MGLDTKQSTFSREEPFSSNKQTDEHTKNEMEEIWQLTLHLFVKSAVKSFYH